MRRTLVSLVLLLAAVSGVCLAQSITVTSPNGGEVWQPGTTQVIKWNYSGQVGLAAKIDLYKSGVLNKTLTSAIFMGSGGSGQYSWAIPATQTMGSDYTIKVTSNSYPAVSGTSSAAFSITNTSLALTSPNGGEVWAPGSTHNITWTSAGTPGTDLKIELLKGGVVNATLAPAAAIANGSYSWQVPANQTIGTDYSVRVTSNQNTQYTDSSNANFTVDLRYTLTVSPTGTGSYSITSSPSGINCPSTCSATFSVGTPVTLTASPTNGTTFNGWSGACSGTSTCPVTMNGDTSVGADFTGPPMSLTMTSPNGGNTLTAGVTTSITWGYTGAPGNVKLELLKSGSLVQTISSGAAGGSSGSGSFSWLVPSTTALGNDYRVRITSVSTPSVTDTSDADFRINHTGIAVTSPNGGENWQAGTTQTLKWIYAGSVGTAVKVDLYKSGVLNRTLISTTSIGSGGSGQYSWVIPAAQTVGSDYTVKVTSTSLTTMNDTSNAAFAITNTSVALTSPNGGEVWAPGSTHNITWTSAGNPGTDLKIELLKGGVVNATVAAAVPLANGSYSWQVPANQTIGSDYAVRITSNQNAQYSDSSNANFTIDQRYTLTVNTTGTGTYSITSSPSGINCPSTCSAAFSVGTPVTLTAAPTNGTTFNGWSGGTCAGVSTCQVTMNADTSVGADFTGPPMSLTVISPNGGNTLSAGVTTSITWSYTGAPGNVKLELLRSGSLVQTISSGAALGSNGSGSFSWLVPSTTALGSDYRIRITSVSNPSVTDSSNSDFRINHTGIAVISPNGGESWQVGTTQTIKWIYAGSVGTAVRVDLYKAGVFNKTLISSTSIGSGGSGQYSWAVPANQTVGSDYTVKVTSTTLTTMNDTSNAAFAITNTSLVLTSPNGGELWRPGTTQSITWTSSGNPGTDLKIELLKSGVAQGVLAASVPIAADSFSWGIPANQANGADYSIRITSNQQSQYADTSDAMLQIDSRLALTVARAGGGSGRVTSTPVGIDCGSTCRALFDPGSGVTLAATADSGSTFTGWSGACSGDAGCNVTLNADTSVTANFAPPPVSIHVTSPNGGETWAPGTSHNVTWTYSGSPGSNVKVELLLNGLLQATINGNTSLGNNGAGSVSWIVPTNLPLSDQYTVRVTSTSNYNYMDVSDGGFTIPGTGVQVTTPNGGEMFNPGQTVTIGWKYSGSVGTGISVRVNQAGSVFMLGDGLPLGSNGTGQISWTIPAATSSGSYKASVFTTGGTTSYSDESNGYFSILQPGINIQNPIGGEYVRPGDTYTVAFRSQGITGDAKVELLKAGVVVSTLASNVPLVVNDVTSLPWTVAANQAAGTDYSVRITHNQSSVTATGGNFTVGSGGYRIQAALDPNGAAAGVFSQPAGLNCPPTCVASFPSGSSVAVRPWFNYMSQFQQWSGDCTGTNSWCQLTMDADKSVTATFSEQPTAILVGPMSGWGAGSVVGITWTYTGDVGPLRIELLQHGRVYALIADGVSPGEGNHGSLNWNVPANWPWTSENQVRITSTTHPDVSGISDKFDIYGVGIRINTPGPGYNWYTTTQGTITWGFNGNVGTGANVDLYRNGSLVSAIAHGISMGGTPTDPNLGSYVWTVPSSLTPGGGYNVRVCSTTTSYCDDSDGSFAIHAAVPPSVRAWWADTEETPDSAVVDSVHGLLFANVQHLNRVDVISTSTLAKVASIPIPQPRWMDVCPGGATLVVGTNVDEFYLVDTATKTVKGKGALSVVGSYPATTPEAPICAADGTIFFRARQLNTTGTEFVRWDPVTQQTTLIGYGDGISRSGDGQKIVFADDSGGNSNIKIFDVPTQSITATLALPSHDNRAVINYDGSRIALPDPSNPNRSNTVAILDGSLKQLGSVDLGGPADAWHMTFGPDNRLYASVLLTGTQVVALVAIDANNITVLGEVPGMPASHALTGMDPQGTDPSGRVIGPHDHGVAFIDASNPLQLDPAYAPSLAVPLALQPDNGAVGRATATNVQGGNFSAQPSVFFGATPANVSSQTTNNIATTAPASSTPGSVNVFVAWPTGWWGMAPMGFSYGPQILFLDRTGGPVDGGSDIAVYGYGFNYFIDNVTASVGGNAAQVNSISWMPMSPYEVPLNVLHIKTPPGTPGTADVTVRTPAGSATLRGGFKYLTTRLLLNTTDALQQEVFDASRQLLYVTNATQDRVEVISTADRQVLTPIAVGDQPVGITMTPDGSRILVVNAGSGTLSIIDAGTRTVTATVPVVSDTSIKRPYTVAATSLGTAFVHIYYRSVYMGEMVKVDLNGLVVTPLPQLTGGSDGQPVASDDGTRVALGFFGSDSSTLEVWRAETDQWTSRIYYFGADDIGMAGDGVRTFFSYIENDSLTVTSRPDSNQFLYCSGCRVYGRKLNPAGSLAYTPLVDGLRVHDAVTGQLRYTYTLPAMRGGYDDLVLVPDNTTAYMLSAAGVLEVALGQPPLTLGYVSPSAAASGTLLRVRGSGFTANTTAKVDGVSATTTFVDANTLQVSVPALSHTGPVSVTVIDGSQTYTLPVGFTAQ